MKKTWMCALALAAALNFSNAEAAYTPPKVPEDIFQWVQSSERMNYFFNKNHCRIDDIFIKCRFVYGNFFV